MSKSFHTPSGIYLLSHSVGCLPYKAKQALDEKYLKPWENLGGNAWDSWLEQIEEFKTALAMLLGSAAESFCPQTNVSSALTKILSSFTISKDKNSIAYSAHDFPSTGFVISQLKKTGYQLNTLSKDQQITDLDEWDRLLSPQTKAVFITHVSSDVSAMAPVKKIIEIAKQHQIITIVDIAQSAGIIPISLDEWDSDFVIGSSVKWLCGGPGAAFLWVNPNNQSQWEPLDVGWFSHQAPFEFDINNFKYAKSANRFWGGTPSIAPFVTATTGIKELLTFGIDKSHKHNRRLTQKIIDYITDTGLALETPLTAEQRGGTVSIRFQEIEKIKKVLNDNRVFYDVRRNNTFRFSPHIYNSENEITTLCDLIQATTR